MPTGAGLSVTALKVQFLRDDGDELVSLKKGGGDEDCGGEVEGI